MFTVTGYIDGVAYSAAFDADATDNPDAYGLVTGTPTVLDLLRRHEGERLDVTPTGPQVRLDPANGRAVLGALYALTEVVEVDGNPPRVIPPQRRGVVY